MPGDLDDVVDESRPVPTVNDSGVFSKVNESSREERDYTRYVRRKTVPKIPKIFKKEEVDKPMLIPPKCYCPLK